MTTEIKRVEHFDGFWMDDPKGLTYILEKGLVSIGPIQIRDYPSHTCIFSADGRLTTFTDNGVMFRGSQADILRNDGSVVVDLGRDVTPRGIKVKKLG